MTKALALEALHVSAGACSPIRPAAGSVVLVMARFFKSISKDIFVCVAGL
jgi:hypothetical protein